MHDSAKFILIISPELRNTHNPKMFGNTTSGWSLPNHQHGWPSPSKQHPAQKSFFFGSEKVIWFWCFWLDGSGAGVYKLLLTMLLMGAAKSFSLPPIPFSSLMHFFPAYSCVSDQKLANAHSSHRIPKIWQRKHVWLKQNCIFLILYC